MQLGSPTQALSTEDPAPDSLLPFDDQDFDQGVCGNEYVCLL
jgi:hypothetical protein